MKKTKSKQKPKDPEAQEDLERVGGAGEGAEVAPEAAGVEAAGAETTPTDEADADRDPIETLKAEIESLEDRLARAKADCQNIQRRSAIERAEAIRYANADLMRSLLGVIDDFERSLEAANNTDDTPSVVHGVRLVYENLMKALSQHGLEPIQALHQPFDPHCHEAIMQQPSEEHPDGTVLTEVAKGFRLRDRVIRPTKVIVSKAPQAETPDRSDVSEEEAAPRESAQSEGTPERGA